MGRGSSGRGAAELRGRARCRDDQAEACCTCAARRGRNYCDIDDELARKLRAICRFQRGRLSRQIADEPGRALLVGGAHQKAGGRRGKGPAAC